MFGISSDHSGKRKKQTNIKLVGFFANGEAYSQASSVSMLAGVTNVCCWQQQRKAMLRANTYVDCGFLRSSIFLMAAVF